MGQTESPELALEEFCKLIFQNTSNCLAFSRSYRDAIQNQNNLIVGNRKVLKNYINNTIGERKVYPTNEDKIQLVKESELTLTAVETYFTNFRRKYDKDEARLGNLVLKGKKSTKNSPKKVKVEKESRNTKSLKSNHRMSSGFGPWGGSGTCYPIWSDFSTCSLEKPIELCEPYRKDYMECLRNFKEYQIKLQSNHGGETSKLRDALRRVEEYEPKVGKV
ncbi:hypothetical protein DLAC_06698 [Tieghemostelium lacteum]|uniref:NADH dehydrogenase [ubiquinone] iron-sulfur protein 5 n=1 Tax=Tieghemostelium lacteum TaxID=361077 RepID=A0A151ZFF5_TIELA|nr:hypothetical protein DLAC_06698 [Tieghemostelium lacteum]|eukprot:KYQ92698.1 hypothetical protein DLAC_06698 [Tieghemostelium lacteum]